MWMENSPNLVFAFTAIGFGIDRQDVDLVVQPTCAQEDDNDFL